MTLSLGKIYSNLKLYIMKIFRLFFVVMLSLQCAIVLSQQPDPSKLNYQMVQGHQQISPADVFETCPSTSFFGQNPTPPDGNWNAFTSDSFFPYLVFDNFSGLPQPITTVQFWGLTLFFDNGWFVCDNEDPMTFEIKFYQDNAGVPGANVNSFTVTLSRDNTGLVYAGFPLYHYKATLSSSVALTSGWISIQGISVADPNCVFLWMNSLTGDKLAYQQDATGAMSNIGTDLSICFEGGQVPVSNWALVLGAVLIGIFVFIRYRKIS
jgi:hypothetical protein